MKNIIKTLTIFIVTLMLLSFSEDNVSLGTRYLKLGNTYREAGHYEKAADYLNKGRKLLNNVKSWEGKYWTAAANEFFGYLFRDIGMLEEAEAYLKEAKQQYSNLISMADGSQVAVESAMNSLKAIEDQLSGMSKRNTPDAKNILNFDKQKLKNLPPDIPADIENLSLADNRFNEFPSGLLSYPGLKHIDISGNRIKSVPDNIYLLKNLHWLDLSENRLKTIPNGIGKLDKLWELDLSDNRLKDLPPGICEMKNLKILNIRNNKIPFEKIANIIKCLPNTNVLFDEYILKEDAEEEFNFE